MDEARQIRDYWFGELPLGLDALNERMEMWFNTAQTELQRERDEDIRQRFGALLERARHGALSSWANSPRRSLSLILLFDQFPRNIYRGSPRAFSCDEQALNLALSGMQSGADAALDPVERMFFYMPLQHAESLEIQEESVAAFRRLVDEAPQETRTVFQESLKFAQAHRDLIRRFGRFPHRNRILGRASTVEERGFLEQGAATFGQ